MTIYMKNVTFKVASKDYAAQLSSVTLTPNTTTATWNGFNGAVQKNQSPADWQADITFGQDWSDDGLSAFLYDNEGDEVEIQFTVAGGPTFTAQATLAAPSAGGAVNAFAESTASLPIDGKPVRSAA
ncbi:hypothetical protein [Curtobacterium sp. MCBA15_008]|uniref:hypothetical protein n=1 Tax=Curtobacterium sp. MCBA15_008 TaxID=1898736 RepID=UPI0008DD1BE9|nr:hypothetical protein [Curtobacterium sp. MCBA15_008]OII04313.1 hypothetical protein BIU96_07895 [Curtobacterium sp. MCBA15_008]